MNTKTTMKTILCLCAALLAGCTTFTVTQIDESHNERTIRTSLTATAWFASAQGIAKIKAVQTDKTQSFGSDAIGQHGSTNTVEALNALARILGAVRP